MMDNYLDIRTLALMMGVVSITLAVGMVYLQSYHKTYTGFSLWSTGAICAGIGGILMCLRGYAPQLVTIIIANTLLMLFISFVSWGVERFVGRKTARWPDYVLLFLFLAAFIQFTYIKPSVEARIVIIGLCFSYFSGKAIFLLKYDSRLQYPFLLAVLWFTAIWFLIRSVITLFAPWGINDFMNAGAFHGVTLIVYILNQILVTIGLILANHHKLESDLTESHQSLKDSEERFRTLSDASFEGILITEEGKIIDANQALLDMLGYAKEESIGKNVIDFLSPEVQEDALSMLLSNYEEPYESIVVKKDGTPIPIEAHGRTLSYQGRMVRVTAIRDLSERKKAQDLLLESQQRLIEAQRIAKVGHYVLDVTSGFWSSSAELDKIFGISKDYNKDVQGWENIIHPDHRKEMVSYLHEHVLGKHHKFDREYKIINQSDQKEYWVHGVGYLKLDDNGNIVEMLGTIQDISERRQLERDLRESQQNMASVLNNTKDGIVRIDKNFRRIYANPAVYSDTGLSKEQYLGKTSREIGFPEELCSLWQEKHERVFQSGKPETYEFSFLSESEGEKVFQAVVSPEFNPEGEVVTIISIMRDITDLKRAESERNVVIADLEKALAEVNILRGLIPICSRCKKIRDDKGYWNTLESYFTKHSEMSFSHSVCEECSDELYGDQEWYRNAKMKKADSSH